MARVEAARCYVYGGVVDLRKGAAGLVALIGKAEEEVLYVFSNRTRELLKFVAVDKTGIWCGTRRLHRSRFVWPESPQGRQKLTADELACLVVGGDLKKHRLQRTFSGQ